MRRSAFALLIGPPPLAMIVSLLQLRSLARARLAPRRAIATPRFTSLSFIALTLTTLTSTGSPTALGAAQPPAHPHAQPSPAAPTAAALSPRPDDQSASILERLPTLPSVIVTFENLASITSPPASAAPANALNTQPPAPDPGDPFSALQTLFPDAITAWRKLADTLGWKPADATQHLLGRRVIVLFEPGAAPDRTPAADTDRSTPAWVMLSVVSASTQRHLRQRLDVVPHRLVRGEPVLSVENGTFWMAFAPLPPNSAPIAPLPPAQPAPAPADADVLMLLAPAQTRAAPTQAILFDAALPALVGPPQQPPAATQPASTTQQAPAPASVVAAAQSTRERKLDALRALGPAHLRYVQGPRESATAPAKNLNERPARQRSTLNRDDAVFAIAAELSGGAVRGRFLFRLPAPDLPRPAAGPFASVPISDTTSLEQLARSTALVALEVSPQPVPGPVPQSPFGPEAMITPSLAWPAIAAAAALSTATAPDAPPSNAPGQQPRPLLPGLASTIETVLKLAQIPRTPTTGRRAVALWAVPASTAGRTTTTSPAARPAIAFVREVRDIAVETRSADDSFGTLAVTLAPAGTPAQRPDFNGLPSSAIRSTDIELSVLPESWRLMGQRVRLAWAVRPAGSLQADAAAPDSRRAAHPGWSVVAAGPIDADAAPDELPMPLELLLSAATALSSGLPVPDDAPAPNAPVDDEQPAAQTRRWLAWISLDARAVVSLLPPAAVSLLGPLRDGLSRVDRVEIRGWASDSLSARGWFEVRLSPAPAAAPATATPPR